MVDFLCFELFFLKILCLLDYQVNKILKCLLFIILEVVKSFSFWIDDDFESGREIFDEENVEILDVVKLLVKIIDKNVL
jgi:hypothetical protein